MSSSKSSLYTQFEDGVIRQGDILRGIKFQYISLSLLSDAELKLGFPFPYAVILSQACDLKQHYKNISIKTEAQKSKTEQVSNDDKILDTVLVCPAFASEQLLAGIHMGEGRKMNDFDGPRGQEKAIKKLKKNDDFNRYHYLESLPKTFPELVIDFKRFHTVPIDILEEYYKSSYLASLPELYRERLSQRFCNYLSRIGLPDDSQNT